MTEKPTPWGPARWHFPHKPWPERHLQRDKQWHAICKSRTAHGNTMENISKTKGFHTHPIVWRMSTTSCQRFKTKECERQNETKNARETKECGREYKRGRGARQNKTAGKGPGLVRGTKGSKSEDKENRAAKQNKINGEGLGLVHRTRGSQSEDKEKCGAKQNGIDGKGLGLVRGTKGSKSEDKRNCGPKQNKWRRPGTTGRNKRKSAGRQ